MTTPAYRATVADVTRDRDVALAIWRGNLGDDARMAAKYDWFYLGNPDAAPMLALLHHSDSEHAIGAVASGARRMLWKGAPLRAGLMVDFTVDPGHRALGPALTLQRKAIAFAHADAAVLYAFPNERAAPVYKRAGYRHACDAIRRARIVHPGRYLARHVPRPLAAVAGAPLSLLDRVWLGWRARGLRAEWVDQAVEDMDTLWQDSDHGQGLLSVRDARYLRWRFDRNPLGQTRYLLLRDADRRLVAWFACERQDDVLVVQDFWSDDAISGLSPARVARLLLEARAVGATVVAVELAGALPASGWHGNGFRERSRRPVYMHARPQVAESLTAVHLTGGDEDE